MGFGVKTYREAAGTGRTLCVFHSASDIMTTGTLSCLGRFHLDGFVASFDTHYVHVRGEVITISGLLLLNGRSNKALPPYAILHATSFLRQRVIR